MMLEQMRQVGTAKGRGRFHRFVIEGTRLVERAVRAEWRVIYAIISDRFGDDPRHQQLVAELEAAGCVVQIVSDAQLNEFTHGRKLGGIVALVEQKQVTRNLLAEGGVICAAVDVIEPGNVGALLRSAHGIGATAFVVIGGSDPYHPKAVRTSMGSLFKLPIMRYPSLDAFVDGARQHQILVVGSVSDGGIPLPEWRWSGHGVALLMGSEFYGLSAAQQARCDQLVTIPMAAGIDSFSVSAAGAILLYATVYP